MAPGRDVEEKAIAARTKSPAISIKAISNADRARLASRRWMLAGLAGMAGAMLASFTGALHLLSPPLESLAIFLCGAGVFGMLAPRRQMHELERDDAEAIALLADRASRIAEGDRRIALHDLVLPRDDELGRLSQAIHDLAAEARAHKHHARLMSRRIGHHVQRETFRATAHLQREAMTDPLTGLGNRRALRWHVERMIATDGPHSATTVMIVDLDQFKLINDTLGHAEGDRCLRFLADVFRSCLRNRDVIVRLGGDEFLAIMPGTTADKARPAVSRLIGLFGQMAWAHAAPRPTLSIGLATGAASDLLDGGTLLEQDDSALYSAKKAGRNRWVSFAGYRDAA